MIIDVNCEDESIQIAKIDHEHPGANIVAVRFLKRICSDLYNFSEEVESISSESISGFYDVDNLEDTGLYFKVPGGYTPVDDSEDEDYICSGSDDTDSESESLVDESECEDNET